MASRSKTAERTGLWEAWGEKELWYYVELRAIKGPVSMLGVCDKVLFAKHSCHSLWQSWF